VNLFKMRKNEFVDLEKEENVLEIKENEKNKTRK
jgi:hypothetical protein